MKTIKLNQMSNKITEKELEQLVSLKSKQDQTVFNIGALESQKHSALHSLAEINQEVEKNKKALEEKYGQVSINLQDGTYEEIKEEVKA
jgi:capsular polysaccharide biosynthesis protein